MKYVYAIIRKMFKLFQILIIEINRIFPEANPNKKLSTGKTLTKITSHSLTYISYELFWDKIANHKQYTQQL